MAQGVQWRPTANKEFLKGLQQPPRVCRTQEGLLQQEGCRFPRPAAFASRAAWSLPLTGEGTVIWSMGVLQCFCMGGVMRPQRQGSLGCGPPTSHVKAEGSKIAARLIVVVDVQR